MIKIILCLLSTVYVSSLFAQPNKDITFRSLQIGRSAREAALGGRSTAIEDQDLNLAVFTPSLLSKGTDNQLSFNYVNYFSDIAFGYLAYSKSHATKPLTFSAAVRFFDYGSFDQTDEYFNTNGQFKSGEYIVQGGIAWQMDTNWRVGANLKFIRSNLETYTASAFSSDVSLTYFNPDHLFGATIMLSDVGFLLSHYNGNTGRLPYDLSIGLSKKLAKSPLRFSLMLDQLTTWDLSYSDPNRVLEIDPLTGQLKSPEKISFSNKLFRHVYGGTEIVFSKNFHFRVGYNYRLRQELKIGEKPGTTGISWGFSMRVSKFHLSYARAKYHLTSPSNHFTLSTNLSTFGKK